MMLPKAGLIQGQQVVFDKAFVNLFVQFDQFRKENPSQHTHSGLKAGTGPILHVNFKSDVAGGRW